MYDLKIINAKNYRWNRISQFSWRNWVNEDIIVDREVKLGASKNIYNAEGSYTLPRNYRYTYTL